MFYKQFRLACFAWKVTPDRVKCWSVQPWKTFVTVTRVLWSMGRIVKKWDCGLVLWNRFPYKCSSGERRVKHAAALSDKQLQESLLKQLDGKCDTLPGLLEVVKHPSANLTENANFSFLWWGLMWHFEIWSSTWLESSKSANLPTFHFQWEGA